MATPNSATASPPRDTVTPYEQVGGQEVDEITRIMNSLQIPLLELKVWVFREIDADRSHSPMIKELLLKLKLRWLIKFILMWFHKKYNNI